MNNKLQNPSISKVLLAFILITFYGAMQNTARAQETTMRSKPTFGVKGGMNISNVYDSDNEDFIADAKIGGVGGLFFSIPIGTFIGFQPELLYSQRGFKGESNLLGTSYSLTRTSTFIDVPLLLAIKPAEMLSIVVGPQYAFLIKQKDEFTGGSLSFEQEEEFKNDNIRKNLLGATFGVDFNLSSLVVGLRAGWDLQKNGGDGNNTTPRYKNAWYQATLGLRI